MDQQPPQQQPLPPYQPDQQQQSPFSLPQGVPTAPVMAPPQPARKRNTLLIVLGVIGGLLALCVVGFIGLAILGSTPQAQQASTDRKTAEALPTTAADADAALLEKAVTVFDEEFSSAPDGLDLTPGEGTSAKVEKGVYVATLEEGGYRSVYSKREITDFISELECEALSGDDNGRCGIVYAVNEKGEDKDNDEYYFFVSGDEYGVSTTIEGDESSFSNAHDAVKSEGVNHLKVIRVGGEARLFVNDTLVDTVKDDKLKSGGVGFAVSAPGGDAEVSVDNWKVWRLP
jgi:hypothetical protein